MEKAKKSAFNVKDQIGYIAGDMAGSFVNLTYDAFFLVFTTYVLKVDPAFMSGLFLFARLFDAINDPIIGSFNDRWVLGKSGDKFKPWIKLFMWPLAISILMGFFDITSLGVSDTFKHVWVSVAYILYGMSYTGTSMPFGGMASVVTQDPTERAKLSAARAIGGTAVGYGFLGIVPLLIWDSNNNPNVQGYMIVAIISAVMCIVCYTILTKLTQERYQIFPGQQTKDAQASKEGYSFFKTIGQAFQNRALLGIMFASIGSLIYITGNSQFGGFIYKEYYAAPKMQTFSMYLGIPIIVVLFFLVPKLTKIIGKRKLLTISLIWNFVTALGLFFIPIPDVRLYVVLSALSNLGQSVFIMTVWAFVADAIDFHEYKFHSRNDGTLYSIYTFSRKIGSTLASFGATALLAAVGFIASAATQTPEVASAVRYLGTGIPVVACAIELIGIMFIFHLTPKMSEEITAELRAREG